MAISSAMGTNALFPGLVLVKSQTVSASTSAVNVDGCFNSLYENYRVVISGLVSSGANSLMMKLRNASADKTASSYDNAARYVLFAGGAADIASQNSNGGWQIGAGGSTTKTGVVIDFHNPHVSTQWTTVEYTSSTYDSWFSGAARYKVDEQIDGFSIFVTSSNTTAGKIRVYGYRD